MTNDAVNHPSHYTSTGTSHEVIEVTRYLDFDLGNVWKYLVRHRKKKNPKEDVQKAIWYLRDYIDNFDNKITKRTAISYTRKLDTVIDIMQEMIDAEQNLAVKNALRLVAELAYFNSFLFDDPDAVLLGLVNYSESLQNTTEPTCITASS